MSRKILEGIVLSSTHTHAFGKYYVISSREKAWLRECSDTRQVGVKCLAVVNSQTGDAYLVIKTTATYKHLTPTLFWVVGRSLAPDPFRACARI